MLAITETVRILRSVQAATDERLRRLRRQRLEEAMSKRRTLNKERRAHLIRTAADILRRGVASKFEFEASCRHRLRGGLCLEGWGWSDADAVAADVVAAALAQIGAVRPTCDEGQPEWTQPAHSPIERVFCERCGTKIPDTRGENAGTATRFCSDLCRAAASTDRHRRMISLFDGAEREAVRAALKSQRKAVAADARVRVCEGCGNTYENGDSKSRFCSRACANRNNSTVVERKCECCGKPFVASRPGGRYCSRACVNREYKVRKAATSAARACLNCGKAFRAHDPATRFCNLVCAAAYNHDKLQDLTCETCKTRFRPRGPFDRRRFCSKRCQPGAIAAMTTDTPPLAPDHLEPVASAFRCDETG